jgi:MarR family transcriptional regulator, lower aerobic nicotinate degradation pathway regulator
MSNVGRPNDITSVVGATNDLDTFPVMASAEGNTPRRLLAQPSWMINQAALLATRLVSEGLAGAHARRHHYSLLAALDEGGPVSQATLSRRTTIDRSDMVATINELAEQGLVERSPDPDDRRRNVITITPAGRRQLRKLDRLLATVQDELLAPLSASERRHLIRLLARIVDHHTR